MLTITHTLAKIPAMCEKECGNCELFKRFREYVMNQVTIEIEMGKETQYGTRNCTKGGTANEIETCIAPEEFKAKSS